MREFVLFRVLSGIERRKPPADRCAQWLYFKPSMNIWKWLDFCESCLKKSVGAKAVRPRIVVECRRNLNQTLKENLLRVVSFEPDFFPMLMRVIEMRRIKGFETSPEKLILLVGVHEPSVSADMRAANRIIANPSPCRRQGRNHRVLCNRHDNGFEFRPLAPPAL
jgi:hypothetical protein